MTALEQAAWIAWGSEYAKNTICDGCGRFLYCRRGRRGPWLCLDCFDQR